MIVLGNFSATDFRLYYSDVWRMRIVGNLIYRADNATSFSTTSDRRIKEDIVDANTSMCYNFVKNVKLKYYKWKDFVLEQNAETPDRHTLGWIAQDVQEYFPKATSISPNYGIDDLLTLNVDDIYKSFYGCVQQIIKDKEAMRHEVDTLKQENALLKSQLSSILQRLDALEN